MPRIRQSLITHFGGINAFFKYSQIAPFIDAEEQK